MKIKIKHMDRFNDWELMEVTLYFSSLIVGFMSLVIGVGISDSSIIKFALFTFSLLIPIHLLFNKYTIRFIPKLGERKFYY